MAIRIQVRRDTLANWAAINPVLAQGEMGHETDTSKVKLGDGVKTWDALPYVYGASGYSGFSGFSGEAGSIGVDGDSGYSGFSGEKGDQGDSGYSGEVGAQGDSGYSGFSSYSGYSGYSGMSGTPGVLVGITYYTDDDASDIGSYKNALRTPDADPEVQYTAVGDGTGVAIKEFITVASDPNVTIIEGGTWRANTYAYIDEAGGTNTVKIEVYKRASGGSETLLFSMETADITGVGHSNVALYEVLSSQSDITLAQSDRIVAKYLAKSTAGKTVGICVGGSVHYSHFHTPLVTQGSSGYSGYSGEAGPQGDSGYSGFSGSNGSNGSDGDSGYSGFSGTNGSNGSDGASGYSGFSGVGSSGYSGYSGINFTTTKATFTNASLSAGVLTVTHNAGLTAPYQILLQVYNNNAKLIIPDNVTGAVNSFAVDLTSYGTLSGTWGYIYTI
jgi:hypothetical protein